jgi:uncharacterized protein (DUF1330 family)
MPAYVTALVTVTNLEEILTQAKQVDATVAQYGGRFIVKGGPVAEVLEGDLLPHTVYDVGVPDNRAGPGVVPFPGVSGHYSPSA